MIAGWYRLLVFFIIAASAVLADVNGYPDDKPQVSLYKRLFFPTAN